MSKETYRPLDRQVLLECTNEACIAQGKRWHPERDYRWEFERGVGSFQMFFGYTRRSVFCNECGAPAGEAA